ncbi:type III effector protein [Ralstonia solanacearum]|uniref:NEL-type E3 ubiquitin ligase domain-containing protein n=1 Tax=Ralstonia solanacearum TaxID=305 RepID=UPI001B3B3398|nr:NEL-type E3 ubiquitin ligase domain-containing protein [Ralstonia solanacearum]MDB0509407.1 NEL domain-containing protein [Ralstonia solanacearum]MDB0515338.1 NEL domain-containing protein [Ralstonia solanacearum]QTY24998.1 type III effector protein [Ralstonia solanacearum]
MSGLSDTRVKRWLKKSASDQYLYAKSLNAAQRGELEQALAQMMRGNTPEAKQALTMWLSVQQARLRTHAPWHQEVYRRVQLNNFIVPHATVVGIPLAVPLHLEARTEYYRSMYRPEYAQAFNNFMSVIADSSLTEIHDAVIARLDYHARREGTIAVPQLRDLRTHGAEHLAAMGYRVETAAATTAPEAGAHAIFSRLEDDLALQTATPGQQILLWQAAANGAGVEYKTRHQHWYSPWRKAQARSQLRLNEVSAFNTEANAMSFARLLARRQASAKAEPAAGHRKVLHDGLTVIHAIAKDAELRALVFAMAEDALGTCRDKVSEGFSAIVNAVGNHQMAQAIKAGRIDQQELQAWAGQQFRLGALEEEVDAFLRRAVDNNRLALEQHCNSPQALVPTAFMESILTPVLAPDVSREGLMVAQQIILDTMQDITCQQEAPDLPAEQRQAAPAALAKLEAIVELLQKRMSLLHEPVETKMHAKISLRKSLDLPDGTVASMAYSGTSTLNEAALKNIEKAVREREANPTELGNYLLSNEIWSTGMRLLHAQRFDQLQKTFEADSFYGSLPPPDDDEHVAQTILYNEEAQAFAQRMQAEREDLFLQCAGLRPTPAS